MIVGTGIVAVLYAAIFCFVVPESRTAIGVGATLLLGSAIGVLVFGPIAADEILHKKDPEWLRLHSFRFHWYASLAMALGLGYLAASWRHHRFDGPSGIALLAVFLGAAVKIAFSKSSKDEEAKRLT
jgi:hypothetical protein